MKSIVSVIVTAGVALTIAQTASAHKLWSNGDEVPEWVKKSCCGPADAHLLDASDVTTEKDGYHIKGYPYVIPFDKALPSQDGQIWLFYATYYSDTGTGSSPSKGAPFCFFIPLGA